MVRFAFGMALCAGEERAAASAIAGSSRSRALPELGRKQRTGELR